MTNQESLPFQPHLVAQELMSKRIQLELNSAYITAASYLYTEGAIQVGWSQFQINVAAAKRVVARLRALNPQVSASELTAAIRQEAFGPHKRLPKPEPKPSSPWRDISEESTQRLIQAVNMMPTAKTRKAFYSELIRLYFTFGLSRAEVAAQMGTLTEMVALTLVKFRDHLEDPQIRSLFPDDVSPYVDLIARQEPIRPVRHVEPSPPRKPIRRQELPLKAVDTSVIDLNAPAEQQIVAVRMLLADSIDVANPQVKLIYRMHIVEGLSIYEIMDRTGLAMSAVNAYLRRGRSVASGLYRSSGLTGLTGIDIQTINYPKPNK